MDLLGQYNSDDESNQHSNSGSAITPVVNLTPHVITSLVPSAHSQVVALAQQDEHIGPLYGPVNPYGSTANILEERVVQHASRVENYTMDDASFNQQLYHHGSSKNAQKNKKRKYKRNNDSDDLARPWSTFTDDLDNSDAIQGFGDDAFVYVDENETEEEAEQKQQQQHATQEEEDKATKKLKTAENAPPITGETERVEKAAGGYSILHLEQERDYMGRTFIHPPSHLKPKDSRSRSFLPKKWIHTYTGHSKSVTNIKFFPKYGHLLLSASMDNTVKIWGTEEDNRVLIRSYIGHEKAIRGLSFSSDGRKFASCSYDKTVKLWDTEYGTVIGTYTNGSIPLCVEIHPSEPMSHQMLAGCHNKKVIQWDTRVSKIVQKYDRHLGPINTITFLEHNRQFLTSSDDKSLRVWEYGIPVEVKYIADPYMHSMPYIAKHPNGKWLLAQSLDNQLLVYESNNGLRQYKKKLFKGHRVGGYACACGFSNDGRYVYSGDAEGNVWFWDWKTGEVITTKKWHNDVSIGVAWHPIEASKVATCSWDGTIKYFD